MSDETTAVGDVTAASGEVETATVASEAAAPVFPPVFLGKHHDIGAFASKDSVRYVLNGVHYNAEKRRIEATDGRVLVTVSVCEKATEFPAVKGGDAEARSCIVPAAAFARMMANVSKTGKRTFPVLSYGRLSTSEDKDKARSCTLVTTDLETEQAVSARAIDAKYPDVEQVWPTGEPALRIVLGSSLLKRIADYAERCGKELGDDCAGVPITFEFRGPKEKVRFVFTLDDAFGAWPEAEGVIAPIID